MDRAALQQQRDALRRWRLTTPMAYFAGIKGEAEGLGLTPYSYVTTFLPDMTDAEIESQFRQSIALGCRIISTNQTKTEMAPRLAPLCDKYGIDLGWHNHTQVFNPNEIASVQVFERLFALSPRMKANLDLGHFAAGNNDTLAFVKAHTDRITHFHMKDRQKAEGAGVPFGEGAAQLREVLRYTRDNHLNVGCIVEYEYPGKMTGLEETQRCIKWMKDVVAA
jgi:sugar phosphate isomerase/epimerase